MAIGGLYAMEESRPDLTRVDLGAPQLADAVVRALLNERMDQSRTLLLPSFLPGGSTRSLARAPSGGPAARSELLELSEDELGRIRSRRFTACIALDGAGTMFSELVLQGVRESLASLDMTLLEVAEAKGSVGMRDMQLQELVRLAPDAIISFSNDQTALRDRFLSLSAERTKLILGVDVPPTCPEYAYATCVATNETEKGRLAGRLLASEMIRRGKRKIGFVCNADINFTARQRDMSAIGTVTEDFPQLDIVFRKDFIREQNALSVVRDALEAHPETEGLYIFSADATLTAQKYLQSIGREDILLVTTQINDEIARLFLMNQNVIGIGLVAGVRDGPLPGARRREQPARQAPALLCRRGAGADHGRQPRKIVGAHGAPPPAHEEIENTRASGRRRGPGVLCGCGKNFKNKESAGRNPRRFRAF